jgi:hypothetical protein
VSRKPAVSTCSYLFSTRNTLHTFLPYSVQAPSSVGNLSTSCKSTVANEGAVLPTPLSALVLAESMST